MVIFKVIFYFKVIAASGGYLLKITFKEFWEIPKSENKKWSLRNDFRAGTTPALITEMSSAENSFFEEHEAI